MAQYAIELHGLTKRFGAVVANDGIDLNVRKGEILALLGENGSGKTTLMNMLSGIYQPDAGEIYLAGKQVNIRSTEVETFKRSSVIIPNANLLSSSVIIQNLPPCNFLF